MAPFGRGSVDCGCAVLSRAGQASANDQALIDFIGYSRLLRIRGIRNLDGSIRLFDHLRRRLMRTLAAGSLFGVEGTKTNRSSSRVADAAATAMRTRSTPAQVAVLSGDGVRGPLRNPVRFRFRIGARGDHLPRSTVLRCRRRHAGARHGGLGFALSIRSEGATREIRDTVIPIARLPDGYGLCGRLYYGDPRSAPRSRSLVLSGRLKAQIAASLCRSARSPPAASIRRPARLPGTSLA